MYRYICLLLLLISSLTYCAEKWRDPHEMNIEIQKTTNTPISDVDAACQRQDKEGRNLLNYYKRSLKILTKHLAQNGQDSNSYDFNLRISADYYNDLLRAIDDISYDFKKLRRLDEVLSHVRGRSYGDRMQDVFLTWTEVIQMKVWTKEAAVIIFTLMLPILIYCYKTASRQTIVLIVLFAVWATDFVITWFNKYEDLEVDLMVDKSRYASSVPTCDLTQMWFFQKWFASLSPTEECTRYYSAIYKNRNYQIGPSDIVIEQAGKMLRIFRFIAIECSKFLTLVTSEIPWPLNWIVIIFLICGGFYILQLVLFLLFGYSFKLNIAHLFHFEIKNDQYGRLYKANNRELLEEVRQEIKNTMNRQEQIQQSNSQQDNISETTRKPKIIAESIEKSMNNSSEIITQRKQVNNKPEMLKTNSVNSEQKLLEHRKETVEIKDVDENSGSDSIEVCEEVKRLSEFDDYVVVHDGNGNSNRSLEFLKLNKNRSTT